MFIFSVGFRSQAANVLKYQQFSLFPIEKPKLPNLTKVTPGSSFEQTMMGWSPRCYIPSFVKIGLPVLEKKIFEGFLRYMGVVAILVM